jgi:hypothetical protein
VPIVVSAARLRRRRIGAALVALVAVSALTFGIVLGVRPILGHHSGPADPFAARSASGGTAAMPSLTNQIHALVPSGITVQVSIEDLGDGTQFSDDSHAGAIEASISKLDILEMLLLQAADSHRALDGDTSELAASMIEQSDNDAGQTLWNSLGSVTVINALNRRLGLTSTVPDPDGYYGLSTTSADDQTRLLRDLINTGPLDAPSRAYALGLLRDVDDDEAWGATTAADPGTTSAVKNGWLAIDSQSDRWVVNSDAIVTAHGATVLISILTDGEADEQSGITLIQQIADDAAEHLPATAHS